MTEPIPTDRARVWKTPPNVALCAEDDIADHGRRRVQVNPLAQGGKSAKIGA